MKSLNEDLNFIRQPSLKNQTSRHCVNEMQMCAPALTRAVFLSFWVLLCPSTAILAFEWLSIRVTLFSFKFCRAHPPSSPLPRGFGWEKKLNGQKRRRWNQEQTDDLNVVGALLLHTQCHRSNCFVNDFLGKCFLAVIISMTFHLKFIHLNWSFV